MPHFWHTRRSSTMDKGQHKISRERDLIVCDTRADKRRRYSRRGNSFTRTVTMSSFTENVSIQPLPKMNLWVTSKPFRYHIGGIESNEIVEVPAWYVFDGASVPMVFGWLIQRVEPRSISAACVHDYLYTDGRRYTRWKTDCIFYESLIVSWVGRVKATLMRLWVFLWGWLYWHKFI